MLQFKDTPEGAEALKAAAMKHMQKYPSERVIGVREYQNASDIGPKVLRGAIQSPQGEFLRYL